VKWRRRRAVRGLRTRIKVGHWGNDAASAQRPVCSATQPRNKERSFGRTGSHGERCDLLATLSAWRDLSCQRVQADRRSSNRYLVLMMRWEAWHGHGHARARACSLSGYGNTAGDMAVHSSTPPPVGHETKLPKCSSCRAGCATHVLPFT
jgi:hypothetical protein